MKYESTRGSDDKVSSAQAIKMGIAPDGGLFVPEKIELVDYFKYNGLSYIERAIDVLKKY